LAQAIVAQLPGQPIIKAFDSGQVRGFTAPIQTNSMKRSLFVFLTGLCLGALAEDLRKERACTEEGCAATGVMLLQTRPAKNGESEPLKEEEEEEEEEEAEKSGNLWQRPGKGQGWKNKTMKPCDKMPKKNVERRVMYINKTIGRIPQWIEKCNKMNVTKLKMAMARYKSCLEPKYGAFVEDAGSEGSEESDDTADEPGELDELVELDDPEEPNELIDTDAERLKRLPKLCDYINATKIVTIISEKIKNMEAWMDTCKTRLAGKLEYLNKALDHYMKCL